MKQYQQIKIEINQFSEMDVIRTSYTDNTLPWVDVTFSGGYGTNS